MKQIFLTLTVVGLVACQQDKPEIHIMGPQFDFTQDEGVSDSLVMGEIEPNIDSLEHVGELLDYLETIPSH
jgi:hypothetical protein